MITVALGRTHLVVRLAASTISLLPLGFARFAGKRSGGLCAGTLGVYHDGAISTMVQG
jgi:hypothetical protein